MIGKKKGKIKENNARRGEDEVTAVMLQRMLIHTSPESRFWSRHWRKNQLEKLFNEVENPLINVLADMEFEGSESIPRKSTEIISFC